MFKGRTDDEARDIVEEDQRRSPLATELHEVSCLDGRLTEEHAVVSDDAHWEAFDMPYSMKKT